MSLETQIAALVTAANNLTNAVSGKMGEIDSTMVDALAQFNLFRAQKDYVGTPGASGTLAMGVFQGQATGAGGVQGYGVSGDFIPADLGTSEQVYIHFKLPFNIHADSKMYWLSIRGYSYGSSKIIDETFAGYCYAPGATLTSTYEFGNMTPAQYVDANGNVVLRILCPSLYVTTLRIDSMHIGGYGIIEKGQIVSKFSLAPQVVF